MAIIVNSPYSGKPVKVRDQDAGRAVKDEEGRIFYVLPRSDNKGFYGAMTRAHNTKDEARALEMEGKLATQSGEVHEQVETARTTGREKAGVASLVKTIILLIVLIVLAWALWMGPLSRFMPWAPAAPVQPTPSLPVPPLAPPQPRAAIEYKALAA